MVLVMKTDANDGICHPTFQDPDHPYQHFLRPALTRPAATKTLIFDSKFREALVGKFSPVLRTKFFVQP